MLTFRIDYRENDNIIAEFESLKNKLNEEGADIEFHKEQLITGDVIVGNCVFERKSQKDFISSMLDNRWRSQLEKMSLNFENVFIVFVGDIFTHRSTINHNAIVGAQISAIIRHGVKIIHAENDEQFVWAVYTTIKKLEDGKIFDPSTHRVINYEIAPPDRFVAALAATGIGKEKALIIAKACDHDMIKLHGISCESLCEIDGIGEKTAHQIKKILFKDTAPYGK
jgi:ERCC4-type nuclease